MATTNTAQPPTPSKDDPKFHPSVSTFNVPFKEYVANYHKNAPPKAILWKYLAVGAIAFDADGRVLLIQRASTDSMPNLWETPGGASDEDDPSVIFSVARELEEETGLKAVSVGPQVSDGYVFLTSSKNVVCKFNFIVNIADDLPKDDKGWVVVVTDPKEHQNHVWATEDEVKAGMVGSLKIPMTTSEQTKVILDAFGVRRKITTS